MGSIIHMTTVHPRVDTRIRLKELNTLHQALGANIALYVQDGKGDDESEGYLIKDTGKISGGRMVRVIKGSWRMYRFVAKANPDVVHFHDPELMPIALLLRMKGIKIVYDVHEDFPAALLSKHYLSKYIRPLVSMLARWIEKIVTKCSTAIVAATPAIAENFPAGKTTLVQNFPMLSELHRPDAGAFDDRPFHAAYMGAIAPIRGAFEMITAMEYIKGSEGRLQLAGGMSDALTDELHNLPGWQKVDYLGWLDRQSVAQMLSQSICGLVLFLPEPNHIRSQPNKMFEYMAAGLPVVASDFPLWREIVDGAECGLLVDPTKPDEIAAAIAWLNENRKEAEAMGRRGRQAVEEKYNWDPEGNNLVELYKTILNSDNVNS